MEEPKTYPATCCECGNKFRAAKSIFQHWGMHERGHGTCKCGAFLNLRFIPGEERMETKKWDDYVFEQQSQMKH